MSAAKPTGKQLSYLRTLAHRTGQTFTHPHTRAQASREIRRLKGIPGNGMTIAEIEPENKTRQLYHDAPLARPYELAGYGSTATWSQRS